MRNEESRKELLNDMALLPMKELLGHAQREGYAVGSFNTNNFEFTKAIVRTAAEEKSPVVIAASEGAIAYAGSKTMVAMVSSLANEYGVRASLHLDHGRSLDLIEECLNAGFASIMIDGSHLGFRENIALTKRVVDMCRPLGVSVEGELGRIAGSEENVTSVESTFTDPDEAETFAEQTRIDALAIAVGTAHGPRKFKGTPRFSMDTISEIKKRVRIPLVLHGASAVPQYIVDRGNKAGARWDGTSGVPDDSIAEAITRGISKVNIDTDTKMAFLCGIRETLLKNPHVTDPRKVLNPAIDLIVEVVRQKMRLFGSSGRAV